MRVVRRWLALGLGAALLAGCGGQTRFVRPGFLEHPPTRVAVLPFVITYPYDLAAGESIPEAHRIGRDLLRTTFYYAFTPYGYADIPLEEVDQRLTTAWGPIEAGGWQKATPRGLGDALGANALIYGELPHLTHIFNPVYTETSLEASLRMVDAATGEVLWRAHVKSADRGGALVNKGQAVEFVKDQVRSLDPSVKFLRVAETAAQQALQGMPNPPMTSQEPSQALLAQGQRRPRLAVLPFAATRPEWRRGAMTLRYHLIAYLQQGPFEVIEPQRIDAALDRLGWREGQPMPSGIMVVAEGLGADAFVRGTVTNWGKGYAVVESWIKAELALTLVDAKTDTVLWSEKKRNTRQAGILQGPTGYSAVVTAPVMSLVGSTNQDRLANHLTKTLVDDLTASAAVQTYVAERTSRPMASAATAP